MKNKSEKVSSKVKAPEVKEIQDVKKTEVKKVQANSLEKPDSSKVKSSKNSSSSGKPNKSKPRKKQARVNWNAARALYATDASQSYRSIAELFGCAENTVERRAMKEGWGKLRKTSGEKIIARAVELAAQSNDEANTRHQKQWSQAAELALKRLEYLSDKTELSTFEARELKQITETLKIATEGERTARGLPNSVIRNQNENKDVDDFDGISDEELDEFINTPEVDAYEHDQGSPKAANPKAKSKDRTSPSKKS